MPDLCFYAPSWQHKNNFGGLANSPLFIWENRRKLDGMEDL